MAALVNLLCAEVLRRINASSEIEFAWNENKGFFRHTAIVLKFDGKPVFTIDYGQKGSYFGSFGSSISHVNRPSEPSHQILEASSQASAVISAVLLPGSDLRVNDIERSEIKIIRSIAKFSLNSVGSKQFVKELIVEIASIKMGKYSVFSNNCRDFVEKAFDVIEAAIKRYNLRSK